MFYHLYSHLWRFELACQLRHDTNFSFSLSLLFFHSLARILLRYHIKLTKLILNASTIVYDYFYPSTIGHEHLGLEYQIPIQYRSRIISVLNSLTHLCPRCPTALTRISRFDTKASHHHTVQHVFETRLSAPHLTSATSL